MMSEMMSKTEKRLIKACFLQTVNLLRFASMVRIRPPPPGVRSSVNQNFSRFFFAALVPENSSRPSSARSATVSSKKGAGVHINHKLRPFIQKFSDFVEIVPMM